MTKKRAQRAAQSPAGKSARAQRAKNQARRKLAAWTAGGIGAVAVAVLAIVLIGNSSSKASVHLVSPADAEKQVQIAGTKIIDVRTSDEFAAGHIAGATVIDVRGADFSSNIAKLDKSRAYVVYCHSGNRSATATAQMIKSGFTHVYEVRGGITAWTAAGLPVTTT